MFVITNMSNEDSSWKLDTLIKPTEKIPLILVADGVFLLVLGLVIIVLHLYEKAEDKKDQEKITAFNYF